VTERQAHDAAVVRRKRAGRRKPVKGLAPRLDRTLKKLLTGLSEKQIAADLELSFHTVHGYVKEIYQHFQVASRSELMAHWVQRNASGKRGR
jgi:DNA-binding NarL/FixJ family response regulator